MFIDCKWVDTRWQWRQPVAVETPGGGRDTLWQWETPIKNLNYKD